jgi:hypothetical protein
MPIPFWHYRIAHSIGVGPDSCFNLIRRKIELLTISGDDRNRAIIPNAVNF